MIAIKEMKMPNSCSECNMTTCKGKDEPWNYACSINLKDIDFNETKRPKDCPLVEVVNCKDCKHNYEDTCDIDGLEVCDDYFCANGKRKGEKYDRYE